MGNLIDTPHYSLCQRNDGSTFFLCRHCDHPAHAEIGIFRMVRHLLRHGIKDDNQ